MRGGPGAGPSVLLVPSLPPGVDELPEEQLAAQGAPGVLGMAATAGEAVGVHHVTEGQGVYLEAQGSDQPGRGPQPPATSSPGLAGCPGGPWTGQLQGRAGSKLDTVSPGHVGRGGQLGRQAWASVSSALLRPGCGGRLPTPGLTRLVGASPENHTGSSASELFSQASLAACSQQGLLLLRQLVHSPSRTGPDPTGPACAKSLLYLKMEPRPRAGDRDTGPSRLEPG